MLPSPEKRHAVKLTLAKGTMAIKDRTNWTVAGQ
jgi:hypothetical protein